MDYDATDIALAYDRGRDHGPENRTLWMNVVSTYTNDHRIKTILDLGCGTGRYSEALAARFDAEVVGVDPSTKMLEQAEKKRSDPRLRYELGCAEKIPLADNSVDLIFISMVFHHFDSPTLAALECHRVLRQGGLVFLRAGTRERISSYPYVDFFPGSRPILEECLFSGASMRGIFEGAGFVTVATDVVTQEIAPNYGAYAEKLSAGADSVLARLSQSEFETGLDAMRLHADRAADRVDSQAVFEPIDVLVFAGGGEKQNEDQL